MAKKIVLLFVIILSSCANTHNTVNFDAPNLIFPAQNLHQIIPPLGQWTPANAATKLSSYGARFDQFVRYLNAPKLGLAAVSVPTQFVVPLNIQLAPFIPHTVPNTNQQSAPSVPFQSPQQVAANNPFSLNMPPINPLESSYITQFAVPMKPSTASPSSTNTGTQVLLNSPMGNIPFSLNRPQNPLASTYLTQFGAPMKPAMTNTNTEMKVFLNSPAGSIPFSLNIPSTSPLDSTYITQFAAPTRPTTTNPQQSNTNTETKVLFNSPVDNQNFGQPLSPMFIESEKIPNNNNSPKFPLNNNIPSVFNTPVTVPKLYDSPTRGFDTISKTQLYSSPTGPPSQQLSKITGQSSSAPMQQIYTLNNFPVLLPHN